MRTLIPELTESDLERFHSKIERKLPLECWDWTAFRDRDGYGWFRLNRQMEGAHRVAYRIANGEISLECKILHSCDNPPCCNPAHLRAGTQTENIRDMDRKGRRGSAIGELNGSRTHPESTRKGEQVHLAKLTSEQVLQLRDQRHSGESYSKLALRFKITAGNVGAICTRKTWKHI